MAQDTFLFNDTLRANVALARPDASEGDIAQAIERAALGKHGGPHLVRHSMATLMLEGGADIDGAQPRSLIVRCAVNTIRGREGHARR